MNSNFCMNVKPLAFVEVLDVRVSLAVWFSYSGFYVAYHWWSLTGLTFRKIRKHSFR